MKDDDEETKKILAMEEAIGKSIEDITSLLFMPPEGDDLIKTKIQGKLENVELDETRNYK